MDEMIRIPCALCKNDGFYSSMEPKSEPKGIICYKCGKKYQSALELIEHYLHNRKML